VTRFVRFPNTPFPRRGRRTTPLPECEQLNIFFCRFPRSSSSSWHYSAAVLAASSLQKRFASSLQKSDLDFWLDRSAFFRDFPAILFFVMSIHSHFDTFTKTFNHGRTSRKQQQQQQRRHHHHQQLRKRESERASSKNFVRKKISQKRFSERVRAREFLWIKISTYKNGDERLR